MKITISNNEEYLTVKATGTFSIHDAKRTFLEVLDAVDRYQAQKVLFDASQLVGEPRTMERFYYGEFVALEVGKLVVRRGVNVPRFAYILKHPVRVKPNSWTLSPRTFRG